MKDKVMALPSYEAMENGFDLIGLIKMMKLLSYQLDRHKHKLLAMYLVLKNFYQLYQIKHMSWAKYPKNSRKK